MSYMLRDRPDGQVEIVLMKPTLIGVFPERDVAQRLFYLLQAEEPELPAEEPASFGRASADVAEAADGEVEELVRDAAKRPRNLPVLVEKPRAPVIRVEAAPQLSTAEIDTAFARITAGEKIADVAKDYGLTMHQLRGMWAPFEARHAKAHGQRRQGDLQALFPPVHPVALQPRHLLAVQP